KHMFLSNLSPLYYMTHSYEKRLQKKMSDIIKHLTFFYAFLIIYRNNITEPYLLYPPFPSGTPFHDWPSTPIASIFQIYISDLSGFPSYVPSHFPTKFPFSTSFEYHTILPHKSNTYTSIDSRLNPFGWKYRTPCAGFIGANAVGTYKFHTAPTKITSE